MHSSGLHMRMRVHLCVQVLARLMDLISATLASFVQMLVGSSACEHEGGAASQVGHSAHCSGAAESEAAPESHAAQTRQHRQTQQCCMQRWSQRQHRLGSADSAMLQSQRQCQWLLWCCKKCSCPTACPAVASFCSKVATTPHVTLQGSCLHSRFCAHTTRRTHKGTREHARTPARPRSQDADVEEEGAREQEAPSEFYLPPALKVEGLGLADMLWCMLCWLIRSGG